MKKILLITLLLIFSPCILAATPDKIDGGDGIYHVAQANASVLSMTIYAIVLVDNDGNTAELFYDASGTEVDLTTGADYTSLVSDANISDGTYTELRLYTSLSIGLQGYVHYQYDGYVDEPGRYYYTKSGSTHEDILGSSDLMADTGFPDPADYTVGNLEMEEGELDSPAYPSSSYPYRDISGICYRTTLDNPIEVSGDETVTLSLSMGVTNGLEFNDADSDSSEVVSAPTNIHFNCPDFDISTD